MMKGAETAGITDVGENKSPFELRHERGIFIVVCDADETFYARFTDETAAYYACGLLNTGFRMGFGSGEFMAQLAMRRALGLP